MVSRLRLKKIARDLLANKSRTLLVILAISVGVFAFGSVFITQEVLLENISSQYQTGRVSDISLFLSEFDSSLVNWAAGQPGVAAAQGKSAGSVKLILPSGSEENLSLFSFPDYSVLALNLVVPKKGDWPPASGGLVLERNAFTTGKLYYGDTLNIKTSNDRLHPITITGSVYDTSAFPYIFTRQLQGFVSWDTWGSLGFSKRFTQLDLEVSPEIATLEDSEKLVFDLTQTLRARGVEIYGSQFFKPHQHWATDNSKAFTAILSVIGVFSLVLSGFLVVNTISALLSQHKKQIGIMKSIGAGQRQITEIYLLMVAVYGLLALVIALPVGLLLGYAFLSMVSGFLNLDVSSFYLPPSVFLMEFAAALIVPLAAAAFPVFAGTKRSVREMLTDYQPTLKAGLSDRLLAKITGLSRPLMLSLRNVFRKKGRLALTLGTLVTAGALFIGVINVRTGMFKEMDRILQMFDFEVSLNLNGDYSVDSLTARLLDIPGVTAVEARTHVSARRLKSDGTKGSGFNITGLPPDTVFSHPVLLSGRWLVPGDKDNLVLSSAYVRDNPDISVGDTLDLEISATTRTLTVVGIIVMSGDQKGAFSDFASVARYKDEPGLASGFLIKTEPSDVATQDRVAEVAVDRLKRSGITVSAHETKNNIYSSASGQFDFMIFFLLAMAVMVAVVGGLGLAGTMSLNVLERTREIGIMRSLGAGDAAIRKLVLVEGLLVGLISWLLALPLSFPLTFGFCYLLGNAFFNRTLVVAVVPAGMAIWFGIILLIAVFSSLMPARRASKMSIIDTLSYE